MLSLAQGPVAQMGWTPWPLYSIRVNVSLGTGSREISLSAGSPPCSFLSTLLIFPTPLQLPPSHFSPKEQNPSGVASYLQFISTFSLLSLLQSDFHPAPPPRLFI